LAWILATHPDPNLRNGREAVRLSEEACRLTNNSDVQPLTALAAAYAEAGKFDVAVRTAEQALQVAKSKGQNAMLPAIEMLRDLYRKQQPFREGAQR